MKSDCFCADILLILGYSSEFPLSFDMEINVLNNMSFQTELSFMSTTNFDLKFKKLEMY